MIISHKHKFIFLKRYKIAGTSFEAVLADFCGDEDIITPISGEKNDVYGNDLKLRELYNVKRKSQNYLLKDYPEITIPGNHKKRMIERETNDLFWNHMRYSGVKDLIDVSGYQTISIVRNPFEKLISFYYWKQVNNKPFYMQDFNSYPYIDVIQNDVKIIDDDEVNHVIRYESFKEDIIQFENKFGFSGLYDKFSKINIHDTDRKYDLEKYYYCAKNLVKFVKKMHKKTIDLYDYIPPRT